MKKSILILAATIISIFVLSACGTNASTDITPVLSSSAVIAEGKLYPARSLDLAFGRNGFVSEVLVKNGDMVTSGQAMVVLEPSPDALQAHALAKQEALNAQIALEEVNATASFDLAGAKLAVIDAQSELDNAQARYDASNSDSNKAKLGSATAQLNILEDKLSKINASDGVDPNKLAAASARLDSAKAALSNAESDLDNSTLRAKMDGTVVDLNLQPGDYVVLGSTIGAVADYSYWIVKTDNLSEIDVVGLETGQTVEVTLDAFPGSVFSGQINNIDSRFVETRGDITYTVTILLKDADPRLRWGMTAAVKFLK